MEKKRYAQRHSAKADREQTVTALSLILLLVCFLAMFAYFVFGPRSTTSEVERRELATMPEFSAKSYLDGSYTAGVTTYFTDTVPFRDTLTKARSVMKGWFGLTLAGEGDVIFLGNPTGENKGAGNEAAAGGARPQQNPGTAAPAPETQTPSLGVVMAGAGRFESTDAVPTAEPVDYTREEPEDCTTSGNVYIVKQNGHYRGMEYYFGDAENGGNYISGLTSLRNSVPDSVKIWSMPAPVAGEFYAPPQVWNSGMMTSCSTVFDDLAEMLPAGVQSINVCDALASHAGEEIYLRTDHHWQPLGAYYAAQQFALAAGVPFADLSTYEKHVNKGYVGTMYGFTDMSDLILNDPDDFTYYVPTVNYTSAYYDEYFNYLYTDDLFADVDLDYSYGMFLGGDQNIVKTTTEVKNGRILLVIKDSYGNATIPFYTSSFEQIYVADVRYFGLNLPNFIKTFGVTDVLFTMSAFSVVSDNSSYIPGLVTQDPDTVIVDNDPDAVPVQPASDPNGGADPNAAPSNGTEGNGAVTAH